MSLSKNKIRFIINCDVEALVSYLQEDYHMPLLQAFDTVYNSDIFRKLENVRTGLYTPSPDYIYEYLRKELN